MWAEQPSAEVFLLSFHFFLLSMFIKIQASLLLPLPRWRVAEEDNFFLCLSECKAAHTASVWDYIGSKM